MRLKLKGNRNSENFAWYHSEILLTPWGCPHLTFKITQVDSGWKGSSKPTDTYLWKGIKM